MEAANREPRSEVSNRSIREARTRTRPPIINIGRLRVDWPGFDRTLGENLKFVAFVVLLMAIFLLLSNLQARWLMSQNARRQAPDQKIVAPLPR